MRTKSWLCFIMGALLIWVQPIWALDEEGLLLFLDFDNVSGNTIKDMSGQKHDGVLNNGAKVVNNPTKEGKGALQIKGGQEQLEVESFPELEEYQDNTYLFWIYFTDAASGGWDQILAKTAPGSDRSPGMWVETGGLGIHWRFNPGNAGFWGLGPDGDRTQFEMKKWYHVAGVKRKDQLMGYVDGKEKAKINVPANHAQGEGGLYVGKSPAYPGPAAKFIMDELVAYARALDPKEIVEIMSGKLRPVDPKDKLPIAWGAIKAKR